jgi:uncharacterized membrane protein HdeD (DUF308 family)
MFESLTRNWWSVALRGLCATLFGLATIAWPGAGLASLMLLFGSYAIVEGVLTLAALFDPALNTRRWALVLHGTVSLFVGALAFAQPAITFLAFVYMLAAWATLSGIVTIIMAIELRKAIKGEWLLAICGVAALLFGLGIAAYPGIGIALLLGAIAAYAIVAGTMQIALGLRLRRLRTVRARVQAQM